MKSNKPLEFKIRFGENGIEEFRNLSKTNAPRNEDIFLVERSAYNRALNLLHKFMNEDFRGNRPSHSKESYDLLKQLGELDEQE